MGKQRSLRSKAVNIVSDFTTVLLNPISDKISKKPPSPPPDDESESENSQVESNSEEGSLATVEGPDTSSFTAFLYSLLKDDYFSAEVEDGKNNTTNNINNNNKPPVKNESEIEIDSTAENIKIEPENVSVVKESGGGKRGLISRGKQSIGKAMSYAGRLAWFRNQSSERLSNLDAKSNDKDGEKKSLEGRDELLSLAELPDMSDNSVLLSENTRLKLYGSLPSLFKGRKWVLLYSTWKHGISLSTLYRKSALCPGLSLLVVGDRGGAVFGGLVEAPLKPYKSRRYQGSNSTFLFSDVLGQPVINRPTGANRYYTLCSPDFLALGGGQHFALYLDSDLLNGSSAASETYGNSCLAHSEDFVVKEVELWGFVYASRYEELLALTQNELPGICRW